MTALARGRRPNSDDFVGQKFGRLLVLERIVAKGKNSAYLCKCDCGQIAQISRCGLRSGTQSCGCLRKELCETGRLYKKVLVVCSNCRAQFIGNRKHVYCPRCANQRTNERAVIHRRKIKMETFDAYGKVCACCGLDDWRFLTIDHIHNDGVFERKALYGAKDGYASAGGGYAFYMHLRRLGYPQGRYQVLCYNCNSAKAAFGECPHIADKKSAL